jgi:hypothetical protein
MAVIKGKVHGINNAKHSIALTAGSASALKLSNIWQVSPFSEMLLSIHVDKRRRPW